MNFSLRRRLLLWLSLALLAAAAIAAVLAFLISYEDTTEVQDDQLEQMAAVLGRQAISPISGRIEFKNAEEDEENQLVVRLLGTPPLSSDPKLDLPLPISLKPGLQTVTASGEGWRVMVGEDATRRRFAIAQRIAMREEAAMDSAYLAVVPLLVLVPVFLVIVSLILRRAFAPMARLSADADRLDGLALEPLDDRFVPLEALPLLQAVNRLMRRLGTTLEQQRRMVSDAAHELRTPVAALILQANNVEHVQLSPEAQERMIALRRGLTRMSSMLDQMLNLARVQGASAPVTQALDLSLLVRTAIEDLLPMAQDRDQDLGCPRVERVIIEGDPMRAYALVRNAVDNAVRYTPRGGSIDVSVFPENGQACFVVEDTGPGLEEADIERVFEPFVRIPGTEASGSGLGLTIVHTAAAFLGGQVALGKRLDGRSGLRFSYTQASVAAGPPR